MPATIGKSGPKKKPTALKVLQGTARHEDNNRNEVKPKPVIPVYSDAITQKAKHKYNKVAERLEKLGIISELDGDQLSIYCQCWIEWENLTEMIREDGMFVSGQNGSKVKNPMLQVRRDICSELRGLAAQFGFTPSSRTGITPMPVPDDEDDILD